MTIKEKRAAGEYYAPSESAELREEYLRAADLLFRYNSTPFSDTAARTALLRELLGSMQDDCRILSPFHCDFGYNIHIGRRFFANTGLVILDTASVEIGDDVLIGPQVGLYAAYHPVDVERRAVLEAIPLLDFMPDVIHCNDWHTAMLPMLARTQYQGRQQDGIRYLLTIHNIAFQGKFGFDYVQELLGIDPKYYTPEFMELYGCADFLKGGCVFADRINTVSPSYAEVIKTSYYSEGLDGILNARGAEVSGIINGIDTKVFNPHSDPLIPANYDRAHMKGKAACKEELQRRMGLEVNPDIPIIAMVTRMTEQKGFDLVASQLDRLICGRDVEFMLLGTGDARFEDFMRSAEARYKGRVCAYIGYNEELAHLVYAGSDFYLMPSRFEPCGLSQMIAMRYGTIPIVRETGGLKDTVEPYNCFTGGGNGFSFANYNADEMYDTILYALGCCSDKKVMRYLISHAMEADFSFDLSAEAYARLYVCML